MQRVDVGSERITFTFSREETDWGAAFDSKHCGQSLNARDQPRSLEFLVVLRRFWLKGTRLAQRSGVRPVVVVSLNTKQRSKLVDTM